MRIVRNAGQQTLHVRQCDSLRASRRKPSARAYADYRKLASHRYSAPTRRVLMRVVGLALHCPRRADRTKLAHVCGSGSSGGHHPSPDDRPTSYFTRRPISLCGAATGVNFVFALRAAVPATPCRGGYSRWEPELRPWRPGASVCPTPTVRSGSALPCTHRGIPARYCCSS
jgi:hypothetical protein